MPSKNIYITTNKQTLIPIYFIDNYKDDLIKNIFAEYKFENSRFNQYLFNLCIDICIDIIVSNPDSSIIFTYPPSTMYYRKEKDVDSMGNLIFQVRKYLCFYFLNTGKKYHFKNLFSINHKYLKNKKAQHINGSKEARTKNLDKRYYLNFFNRRFLRKLSKRKNIIVIIDDVSSTGGTLFACKNSLEDFNFEVELYSLAH